jgi:zinc/manganese transport system substrate-binding protein
MRSLLILLLLSTPAFAKPLVVTTFSILGDMVVEIGQDKVDVRNLVGPNQDSHVYEPKPQDAKELGRADLIVVNGLGFEGWIDRLIEASGFNGKKLVVTTGIAPLEINYRGKAYVDPHAWHSLKAAQIYVDNIVKGLSELVPDEAPFFKKQGDAYKQAIAKLEQDTQKQLESIPLDQRKVITNHEAFGYLGRDFGLTFSSPQGISTDAEPSAKVVAALIRRIKEEKIQAVFIENISNPRLMNQIASETGTKVGGVLYSDALSAPGTEADTYLKMMASNLATIVRVMKKQ